MAKILLIWNDRAGKVRTARELRGHAVFQTADFLAITRHTKLTDELRKAVDAGCEMVVAAGGDGTVNAIVNALMSVDPKVRPSLGILPLGTANDFAGCLCIPDEISAAIELVETAAVRPVDVVRIEADGFERYYANVAAGGNSVRVSEEMTAEMKERWGAFCYLRGAIEVLSDLKSFRITAKCDDELFSDLDTWAVLVANGKTNAGRIVVAPQASPVDGLLDVVIIRDGSALDIIEIVSNALLGSFVDCEQVIYRQVKRLHLHSQPSMRFTLDGEVIDREPVRFEVVPAAIRMCLGSTFNANSPH